ncbi:MAG: Na/Pi symporter [Pseudomonadales bacterium]|nr:Na/Pi symporter [Pseudomonadales bacterium]
MLNLTTIGMLAGGVGIFLLAVGMITDGLKLAAGTGLRTILGRWTRSPAHGVFSGFMITAIVQSSSAITVATIGFVNAGLMTLSQSLGVIFGANVGTTVTGWLVAFIGFEVNISAFSLPMIGLGMLLRLSGGQSRRAAIGTALVGFGLFFIGIQILKDAFEGIVAGLEVDRLSLDGVGGLLLYLGMGFLMTVLTQSSSAAIAITLTAASSGLLGIYAAGAMVIGANVGTTSTAVLSVIGATANAKRVAAAHVLFNGITGLIALLLLPVLFLIINAITSLLDVEPIPTVTLALFHTVFNVLGVIIMLPFAARLASFLSRQFSSKEEILGHPQHLDKTLLSTADLALNAAVLELQRLAKLSRELCLASIKSNKRDGKKSQALQDAATKLFLAIGDFVMSLQRGAIPADVAAALPKVLRCSQYFHSATELAALSKQQSRSHTQVSSEKIEVMRAQYQQEVESILKLMDPGNADYSDSLLAEKTQELKSRHDDHKEQILQSSVAEGLSVTDLSEILDHNSTVRRMVTQMSKGTLVLSSLLSITNEEHREKVEADALHEQI